MKQLNLFAFISFFCFQQISYAQPANDECNGAIELQTTNFDKGDLNFENATNSINGCGGIVKDIWFSFEPNSEVVHFQTDASTNPNIEIYDACGGNIVEDCFELDGFFSLYVDGLDTTSQYFIRAWAPDLPEEDCSESYCPSFFVQDFNCDLKIDSVTVSEASCFNQEDGQIRFYFNNPYDGFNITNARVRFEGISTGIGGAFDSYNDDEVINHLPADQYLITITHSGYSNCFIVSDTITVGFDPSEDIDEDEVVDCADNCPQDSNGLQEDGDKDGKGDICDECPLDKYNDIDGDGVCGDIDNCPSTYNPNQDPMACDLSGIADCRTRDSLALVAFLIATRGDQWIHQWDLTQPMTSWYGVITNASGCVTELNLSK